MGWYQILTDTQEFVSQQVPSALPHPPLTAANTVVSLQLGNLYLLFAALFILLCFFSTPGVVKAYLLLGAAADIGHIYGSYVGMGTDLFWGFGRWNVMAWGNVGASAFLCVNRILTVLGVFGNARGFGGALKRD
jgi:hypothetical protein